MAQPSSRSLVPPVVVGVGLGGFFDGIVLHQILQWHHLMSAKVSPDDLAGLQANTLADGLFHQAMWVMTLAGVFLLYTQLVDPSRLSIRRLVAGMLVGFGTFNLFDEVVFHVLLELHHIRPGPDYLVYDLAFTAWGAAMVVGGWWLLQRDDRREAGDGSRGLGTD